MNFLRAAFLIVCLGTVQGCAAIALTAGGIAGGTGVDHTLSGIAYKTFPTAIAELRLATLTTLKRMDMPVSRDEKVEDGWEIEAKASDRKIEIELESLTKQASRMRVVVHKGNVFFRDAATGTEIVIQTAETLDRQSAALQDRK